MPYKNLKELPEDVTSRLSLDAQRIYVAAFNCAWEQYQAIGREQGQDKRREMADKVARNAVSGAGHQID